MEEEKELEEIIKEQEKQGWIYDPRKRFGTGGGAYLYFIKGEKIRLVHPKTGDVIVEK